ncbi:MAG: response regulator transcription factor [Cellvibrionaceae bacterium]
MMPIEQTIDILLVEDNHDIAENILLFLEDKGHRLDTIYSAEKALNLLEKNNYDILILDVMLPGMDGFLLAEKLRTSLNITTPILFLTARDTLDDKLSGFNLGADDYLTKPFNFEELEARILAVYRRAKGLTSKRLTIGDWDIDEDLLEFKYKNQVINTTQIGFKIIKTLLVNHPNITPRRELEKRLWGDNPPDSDAIRSHIFMLRKAITPFNDQSVIETVHGVGFKLNI